MARFIDKAVWLVPAALVILYIPIFATAFQLWMTNENYSHCVFIIPISIFLLWLLRDEIKVAKPSPTPWGMLPLSLGLLMQFGAYLFALPYIGVWSVVPVVAGCVLLLHGTELWKVVQFPVCYLLLAGSLPTSTFSGLNAWIQHTSTVGAAMMGQTLGFVLVRHGNFIEVPGMSLEVMMACSGYKKLVTLISFSLLYGFLFTASVPKRVILVLAAVPIAVIANCLRITGLIAASSAGGMKFYHIFHTPTDLVAIVIALFFLVLIGKQLGCTDLRYSF